MLILAGIVLTMTIGENGIIGKAIFAKNKWKNAVIDEEAELAKAENYLENSRETITIDKEEYDKLKQDIEDLKTAAVENNKFSLDEKAIGKWVDGRTIYRKSFIQKTPANSGNFLDLSSLNIDNFINIYGTVKGASRLE